jgi:hypothetical protein
VHPDFHALHQADWFTHRGAHLTVRFYIGSKSGTSNSPFARVIRAAECLVSAGDALGCDRASNDFGRKNPSFHWIGHESHRDTQKVEDRVLGRARRALTVDRSVLEVGSNAPVVEGNRLELRGDVLSVARNAVIVARGGPDCVATCFVDVDKRSMPGSVVSITGGVAPNLGGIALRDIDVPLVVARVAQKRRSIAIATASYHPMAGCVRRFSAARTRSPVVSCRSLIAFT